jgi:oligoendopeptidase F
MAQAIKSTGAEHVRWDLTDLFQSPTDPAIETTLAEALKRAKGFEARYKGKVVSLSPKEFAAMMRELEEDEELGAKPDVYAYLLHSQNTEDPAAGRLLARVREAGAERGSHAVFFTLELAQISDEQAARLYAEPDSARYKHMVEEARKFRPHQLSEPEERVLTDFSPVGNSAWNRLFEELCARIRVDLDGRKLPLDEALVRLREADRTVRREASGAITQALDQDLRTRGYIFNVIACATFRRGSHRATSPTRPRTKRFRRWSRRSPAGTTSACATTASKSGCSESGSCTSGTATRPSARWREI